VEAEPDTSSNPVDAAGLNTIVLKREFLEKNVEKPWFNDIIAGFYVRVGIGSNDSKPVYRVAQIVEVKENPAKKYNLGKKVTNKFLYLRHGIQQKLFSMENVSNKAPTENEFSRWKNEMEKNRLDLITLGQAKEKENLLIHAQDYIITDEDINKMVEQNRTLNKARLNMAAEKVIYKTQREAAKDEGDMEEYEKLGKKIEEIDAILLKAKEKGEDKTAAVNRRNKLANTTTKYETVKVVADELHDPFSRRATRSAPTFVKPKEDDAEVNGNNNAHTSHAPKQPEKVVPPPPTPADHPERLLKSAHDFDLDINTTQISSTAPVYKSSATTTLISPLPSSDKPKTALSVNDYKIRRGLV